MAETFAAFPLVEVQRTFYQPPRVETAQRWRERAPAEFIFTLKAWQVITHPASSPTYRKARLKIDPTQPQAYGGFQPSGPVVEAWERTLAVARALAAPVVVFQCPASFRPLEENLANMRRFFRAVERDGMLFAWEPRGPWPDALVLQLCQELDLIHCVDPFQRPALTHGTAYFRLHGVGGYRYTYTARDLRTLLELCREYELAYVLFNNLAMWENGLQFLRLVEEAD
jgi:uncharacterized protein YecE (DUF72 family)